MKFRKAAALLLVAVMTLSFAACGGNEGNEQSGDSSMTASKTQSTNTSKATSAAYVVESKYYTDRVIVAEVDATSEQFGADPTGKTDSTVAIQTAIDHVCFRLKGGTVYLPAGNYRVEGRIIVRNGVTLLGDYVDPDKVKGTDYGTMLWVYTQKRFKDGLSAIQLSGSSAIDGLTVYYPEQNAENPVDYYYTIDSQTDSCRTIKNVTLLNSYCGVTSPTNGSTGMNTIDNLKGTILNNGLYIYSDADISYYSNMYMSPKYWASMDGSFNPPAEKTVRNAMRKSNSSGVRVQNTDRDCFRNLLIDGFKYGFYSEKPDRSAWNGSVFNATVKNTEYGVYSLGSCAAYGTNFSQCDIQGSSYAILNESASNGYVNLYNVKTSGKTSGNIVNLSGEDMTYTDYSKTIPMPASAKLFNAFTEYGADNTAKSDSTAAIQKALDAAKANGGGIVYVPGGEYRIDGALTVSEGVMLLGSSYYSCNSSRYGTIIYAYGKDKEMVTVSGKKAGVVGFTFVYPENGTTDVTNVTAPAEYPYTIKCVGEQTYVKSVTMVSTSRGVLFENSDNFIIDRLLMNVWHNGVKIKNSDNGYIYGIHVNVTYQWAFAGNSSHCKNWLATGVKVTYNGVNSDLGGIMIDQFEGKLLTLFEFVDSKDIQLIENFHYGAYNFAKLSGSSVFFINCEGARINDPTGRLYTLTNNSSLKGANMISYGNPLNIEAGSTVVIGNLDNANKPNTYYTN